MTVGELISLFPADSTIQINVKTGPGSLVFIPDPGYYQQHPKAVASVDKLPVTSVDVEVEDMDGRQFILLIINDECRITGSRMYNRERSAFHGHQRLSDRH